MALNSRYTSSSSKGGTADARTTSSGESQVTGSVTNISLQDALNTSVQNSSTQQNSTTKNYTGSQQKALDALIAQLSGGGTPAMQQAMAARQGETQYMQAARSGYSKEAAFGDAQGLISQQMRRVLEQLLPAINRAAEDAGSSGGAVRALLMQDAAAKAAESSSALGVQTAANYGNVAANMSQVVERLTASNVDPATEALIQALNAAKGGTSTTRGNTMSSGSSSSRTQTSGTQTQNSSQNTREDKSSTVDYAPFGLIDTTPKFYDAVETNVDSGRFVGTTTDFLAELSGVNNPWAGYSQF